MGNCIDQAVIDSFLVWYIGKVKTMKKVPTFPKIDKFYHLLLFILEDGIHYYNDPRARMIYKNPAMYRFRYIGKDFHDSSDELDDFGNGRHCFCLEFGVKCFTCCAVETAIIDHFYYYGKKFGCTIVNNHTVDLEIGCKCIIELLKKDATVSAKMNL